MSKHKNKLIFGGAFLIAIVAVVGILSQTIDLTITGFGSRPKVEKKKPKSQPVTTEKEVINEEDATNTPTNEDQRVIIETDKGTMIIALHADVAPKTVENFVTLIQKGFYNGLKFHRIVPGFVVQGGDPKGDGTGGPGYQIKAEFNEKKHLRGTVAMARSSSPDSAGSQFYICIAPQPSLDGQYTVFGQVVEGDEVIDKLAIGDVMSRVYLEPTSPE